MAHIPVHFYCRIDSGDDNVALGNGLVSLTWDFGPLCLYHKMSSSQKWYLQGSTQFRIAIAQLSMMHLTAKYTPPRVWWTCWSGLTHVQRLGGTPAMGSVVVDPVQNGVVVLKDTLDSGWDMLISSAGSSCSSSRSEHKYSPTYTRASGTLHRGVVFRSTDSDNSTPEGWKRHTVVVYVEQYTFSSSAMQFDNQNMHPWLTLHMHATHTHMHPCMQVRNPVSRTKKCKIPQHKSSFWFRFDKKGRENCERHSYILFTPVSHLSHRRGWSCCERSVGKRAVLSAQSSDADAAHCSHTS